MFINGTDLNGDSVMDLVLGLSTGGIKILYGSRVNSIAENSSQEENQNTMFRIYPNPTKGELNIELLTQNLQEQNRIEVRGISGQLIFSENISGAQESIDISHLSKGLYFITISNSEKIQTEKIILRP